MQNVVGKVAFITGGASGLGLAMARSFTGAGMKVVIADIQQDALDAAAEEFAESNAEVLTLKVDVSDRDAMEDAANKTIETFNKIHVLCNNAGVAMTGNISDHTYKDWDWVMDVNLNGVINGVVSFVKHIKEHGEGGHIVNTASMAGQISVGDLSIYGTTKFAVVGMSEAMQHDLAQFNIGTSVLCPGFVATNIFTSERNRPGALGGAGASSFSLSNNSNPAGEELEEKIRQMMASIMPPAVIGDMVLEAIQKDIFYIFSHPDFKESLMQRFQAIGSAFDHWADYRKEHDV